MARPHHEGLWRRPPYEQGGVLDGEHHEAFPPPGGPVEEGRHNIARRAEPPGIEYAGLYAVVPVRRAADELHSASKLPWGDRGLAIEAEASEFPQRRSIREPDREGVAQKGPGLEFVEVDTWTNFRHAPSTPLARLSIGEDPGVRADAQANARHRGVSFNGVEQDPKRSEAALTNTGSLLDTFEDVGGDDSEDLGFFQTFEAWDRIRQVGIHAEQYQEVVVAMQAALRVPLFDDDLGERHDEGFEVHPPITPDELRRGVERADARQHSAH